MTRTIFEKIWDQEIPSYELYRRYDPNTDQGVMAILDVHPATPGHVMIIPKQPARTWLQLGLLAHQQASTLLWLTARHQKKVLGVGGVVPANFGEQVPHAHYHAMPKYPEDSALGPAGNPIRRMHPNSGRMQESIDHSALTVMHKRLAFPRELVQEADEQLARLSAAAIHFA